MEEKICLRKYVFSILHPSHPQSRYLQHWLVVSGLWGHSLAGSLTVARQLSHGGHEGTAPHVARERVLWRRMELLLEGEGLQGGETTPHVVDDRYSLRLRRG